MIILANWSIPQGIWTNEVAIESFNEIQKIYLKEVLQIKENDLLSKARAVRFNSQRYNTSNVVVLDTKDDIRMMYISITQFVKH